MKNKKIMLVVGARPNFMKMKPVYEALKKYSDLDIRIIHTGQHYDYEMSQVFFENLSLPKPDIFLNVRSGTHGAQTAKAIEGLEKVFVREHPALVVVFGDVNSTLAASISAAKLMIPIAHVEAGLRSFDRTMPEEINRVVTDVLSSLLFVTEESGVKNLKKEGIPDSRIYLVGNTMIDTLFLLKKFTNSDKLREFDVKESEYTVVTLHRPSNVDNPSRLKKIISILDRLGEEHPVLFPIHPRTKKRMKEFNIRSNGNLKIIPPLNYIDFLSLQRYSGLVITDSGGIQEETTVLGVPCITVRSNTERPITEEIGTNVVLKGRALEDIIVLGDKVFSGRWKKGRIPELWDGKAGERIARIVIRILR